MEPILSQSEIDKIADHWFRSSESDFTTMIQLYEAGSYSWSLFIGHITVEKLLKGLYVKKHHKHAPFTHNLYRLAELCEIELTEFQADQLVAITAFNLNTRYDDYKNEFYKKCTPAFTFDWVAKIKDLRQWLIQQF